MSNKTVKAQKELAKYARTGELPKQFEDLEDRLKHYHRLVFNVHFGILSQAYPIAKKVLSNEWRELIKGFLKDYDSSEEEVWKMPAQFIPYIQNKQDHLLASNPWLIDLLTLEWTEIFVHSMPNVNLPAHTREVHPTKPVLVNPYLEVLKLDYPVHRVEAKACIKLDNKAFVAVARDDGNKVRFTQISSASAMVLAALKEGHALIEVAQSLGTTSDRVDSNKMSKQLLELIKKFQKQHLIMGSLR